MKFDASSSLVATALLALSPRGGMAFPGESDPNLRQPDGVQGGPPEGVIVPHGGGGPPGGVPMGPPEGVGGPSPEEIAIMLETVEPEYARCKTEIIDVHMHTAFWFNSAAPLVAEMNASYVSKGVMLAVYGPVEDPFTGGDPNEQVEAIVKGSEGRLYGLASLNTTVPNWEENGKTELDRLDTFLAKPEFLGIKLAPPHTCMALNSDIMGDVVHTVSNTPSPLVFIHVGTTPFCGPFGAAILGRPGCCGPEYVNPAFMEDLVKEYTNTTFVLVHVGADFLDPTDEFYYNGENVGTSISMAQTYDNVYLELSAFLRQDNGTDVYPGGNAILEQIADAGLAHKTFYGSDVNQSPGSILPYLSGTIEKLITAGFTEEERCMILGQNSAKVFGMEAATDDSNMGLAESTTSTTTGDDADSGIDAEDGDAADLEELTSSASSFVAQTTSALVAMSMASLMMMM